MGRTSVDRTRYYQQYYLQKKDQVKSNYYEKKERNQQNDQLYAEYGGEQNYYLMKYKEFGSLGRQKKIETDLSLNKC
jgi:hypothetical protein